MRAARQREISWTARARQVEEARRAVHETWRRRGQSQSAWQTWSEAAAAFHRALDAAYPPGFRETFHRLKSGEADDLEPLIAFVEADPIFFRSGYMKADCIRLLKRQNLTEHEADRLRQALLKVVDQRDRREFRHFCRLARAVDSPDLRAALRERLLTHPDPNVRRRAGWALHACEQKQ